jgi:hypothetical protein
LESKEPTELHFHTASIETSIFSDPIAIELPLI